MITVGDNYRYFSAHKEDSAKWRYLNLIDKKDISLTTFDAQLFCAKCYNYDVEKKEKFKKIRKLRFAFL
jgi:hypothetical protein